MALEEHEEPEIEVVVQYGEVTQVFYQGKEVRALVRDYDVEFPCIAHGLKKDTDGDFYMEIVV